MLSDFDRTTKLFRAALTALGNDNSGAIATLNTLLKRTQIFDKEQQEIIAPMLGELKALLLSSQDELKNFNKSAQESLQSQIKNVIGSVDLSPIKQKVEVCNAQILESTNELSLKIEELQQTAAGVVRVSKAMQFKMLLVGVAISAAFLFGLYQYKTAEFEQTKNDEFNTKWQNIEDRLSSFKSLKSDAWGATIVTIDNQKYLQLVVVDNSGQVALGRSYSAPDQTGKKRPVSFINIPIYK